MSILVKKHIALGLALIVLYTSCGSAYITTDPGNSIYINGNLRGKEIVKIRRNGFLKKINVEVRDGRKRLNKIKLKRKFTLSTAGFMLLHPLIGFLFGWQYPKDTYIKGKKRSLNEESIWSKAPSKTPADPQKEEKSSIWE